MTGRIFSSVDVVALFEGYRFNFANEGELQQGIASALAFAGAEFEREVVLSGSDRIDFLIATAGGGCGVEIKVDGSLTELIRQLHRYASHERIASLIIVTSRMRHRALPRELGGKHVAVVHLVGSSL